MRAVTPFERLGGETALRPIIDDFVDRVFGDTMIGFFFRRVSRDRVKQHEYEHAAKTLGADVEYRGRPIDEAHRAHVIAGGHFLRRKEILRQTLVSHRVPDDIVTVLLDETERLRPLVTGDRGSECITGPTRSRG
jgi:hemoglobin